MLIDCICCRELEIIHTDFKPENVMLVETLQPRHWEMVVQQPTPAPSTAAAAAAGQLTKNQKKKAKRKAKKTESAATNSQEVSYQAVLRTRCTV
jgi:ribosomal protein L12E/L44/L45/RPP1/RPP2